MSFAPWQERVNAEIKLDEAGYEDRLCYAIFQNNKPLKWQIWGYRPLPSSLDYWIIRKCYAIWLQSKMLLLLSFQTQERNILDLNGFSKDFCLNETRDKTGRGPLSTLSVIQKQIIFPDMNLLDNHDVALIYNYAPLRTGGEELHFLLIPTPHVCARNFLELEPSQYLQILTLAQKVTQWASERFGDQCVVHFFDKRGELAGQTQPIYHAHLIIIKKEREERLAKLALLFRLFLPPRPLSSHELQKRVVHYRQSLGSFLAQ